MKSTNKTTSQVIKELEAVRLYTAELEKVEAEQKLVEVRPDGTTIFTEASISPLRNDRGEIIGVRGIGRDVTERIQMERALRPSEERYRTILDEIEEGYYEVDLAGNFTFVNNATCRQFGYPKEELIGMNYRAYVPKEDAKSVYKAWNKVYRTGEPLKLYPFASIRKDGTQIFLENSVSPLRNNEGKTIGFRSISRDVTERKRAEDKMQHSKLVLRAIRNVNQLIARRAGRDSLLKGTCENFVETRGYYNAWIALLDESGKLVVAAEAGLGKNFLQMIERLKRGELPDCGRKMLKKSGVVVIEDPSLACTDCPLAKDYSGRGEMSVRLEYGEKVYGLMTVSIPPGIAGEKEEQGLFEEVAGDIAFALHSMEQEEERKRAEEALRESEEKYRLLAENARDIIWTIDMNLQFTYMSPSVLQVRGYTVEEVMAQSLDEVFTPSSLEIALKAFAEELALESMEPKDLSRVRTLELEHICKNGSTVWVEINASFIRDADGQPVGILGVSREITERRQSEEAQRRSEERYRTIVEEMDESYYEVDLAGNMTFVNDATCRRLGRSREELIGMKYKAYTPAEDTETVFKIYNRVYRTGKPVKGVPAVAIAKDGSLRFVERSVFPLRDEERKIIGFRGISRDVTDSKRAEEERMQLELKAQITSRLASVGEMAAGVAHEINNPLTAVTGYAQLLVDREDVPPDIRSDLAAINDGARRVAGIVQRLLVFSRQTKPQRKLVDINELIESTLVLRTYHLKVNNIEVVTRLAPDLLETVVDPGQIQQVLLNLIVNAETEMKLAHGKGKLTITTKKSDNTIKICCQDNGPGIKPEVMDKIFDPFFTTRDVGQGTGLGLSLCYGIIAEHKGRIYAESKPGKGATFIIELPVVTEVAPPKPAEPVVKKSKKAVKARILVVDDEQVVRDVINRVLTGEGHKVETVDNAADALKKIENKRYNLILVDIKMPGTNGMELYESIQKIARSLARRVVFITGDIMGADTEKFLSETKVAHIEKPFDAERLSTEVQRALTGGR